MDVFTLTLQLWNSRIHRSYSKLLFNEHITNKICKETKGIGLLIKFQNILPYISLLIIYKSLKRPHLDYGDVIYDRPSNASLSKKIESMQYNATLAITWAMKGSSREKLYQELGLKYLQLKVYWLV